MSAVPDYLEKMGATLPAEPPHCFVVYKNDRTGFGDIGPVELRQKVNAAMAFAIPHYVRNVEKSGVQMGPRQIAEAALAVVPYTLRIYNVWRHTYEQYKDHALNITQEDLDHVQSQDQCWFYCQREFGAEYVSYAAALIGMTRDGFLRYEQSRNAFFDR